MAAAGFGTWLPAVVNGLEIGGAWRVFGMDSTTPMGASVAYEGTT